MAREMKDSCKLWIGSLPSDWNLVRIKNIIQESKDGIKIGPFGSALTNKTQENGEFCVYSQANLIASDFSSTKHTVDKDTFEELQNYEVYPNDICLSMMGTIGKCKKVPGGIKRGIMDSHLIKIRLSDKVDSRFFEYAYDKDLGAVCFSQMQFDKKGFIMDGLNTSIVKNLYFPLPSLQEQNRISDYLDVEVACIDSVIDQTRASIEEYKKLKQAVITQAVTKGIRPDRQMKDSGVEWIGDISSNYELVKLKHVLKQQLQYGANQTGIPFEKTLPRYIRITDIGIDGKLKESGALSLSEEDAAGYILENNDVLFARSGGTVGKAFIYKDVFGRSAFAGYLIKATLGERLLPDLLFYYTQSSIYEEWKSQIFIQATIQNIGADRYREMPIILQPIDEQREIVSYLNQKCNEIDVLISRKDQVMIALESYKKSLIYEYVTGKKEVPA